MLKCRILAAQLLVLLTLQACSSDESAAPGADPDTPATPAELGLVSLAGSVDYSQLGRLPPTVVIHVELQDITDGVEDPPVLASTQSGLAAGTASPLQFELFYDRRIIRPERRYSVISEVRDGRRVLYENAVGVDPFAVEDVALTFLRPPGMSHTPASLQGNPWLLSELGGEPVTVPENGSQPFILLDEKTATFSGSAGCNNYGARYELDGQSLLFRPVLTTRKACMDAMELEARYLAMLPEVAAWRLGDRELVLLDSAGNDIARFKPGH